MAPFRFGQVRSSGGDRSKGGSGSNPIGRRGSLTSDVEHEPLLRSRRKGFLGGNAFPLNWTTGRSSYPLLRGYRPATPRAAAAIAQARHTTREWEGGVQHNDRAASISRDDKHCGAGEVLPPRFVHAASTTLTLGSLPPGAANQAGGKVATRDPWGRLHAMADRRGREARSGRQGRQAMAISGRSARRPAARATAREAADGSQMSVRLRGALARVRRRPAQLAGPAILLRRYRDDRENGLR
jgi:hypothetical protein